jgi:predicted TIM-barrel fold metal-dependent hydrolase
MTAYRIFDTHAHIYPAKIAGKAVDAIGAFYNISMSGDGTAEGLLANGKKIGTEKYVVHSVATTPAQVESINRFIMQQAEHHEEFVPYATLHPYLDQVERVVESILEAGYYGIKLHPDFQNFAIDDEKAMAMYKVVAGKLPILFHMGDETRDTSKPERLARVMDKLPDLVAIGAHMGGYQAWDEASRYLVGRNVYFDESSTLFKLEPERVVEMIRAHGADKILFGSDFPMWPHDEELARFMALDLSEEERRMILWDNAASLLGFQ